MEISSFAFVVLGAFLLSPPVAAAKQRIASRHAMIDLDHAESNSPPVERVHKMAVDALRVAESETSDMPTHDGDWLAVERVSGVVVRMQQMYRELPVHNVQVVWRDGELGGKFYDGVADDVGEFDFAAFDSGSIVNNVKQKQLEKYPKADVINEKHEMVIFVDENTKPPKAKVACLVQLELITEQGDLKNPTVIVDVDNDETLQSFDDTKH